MAYFVLFLHVSVVKAGGLQRKMKQKNEEEMSLQAALSQLELHYSSNIRYDGKNYCSPQKKKMDIHGNIWLLLLGCYSSCK